MARRRNTVRVVVAGGPDLYRAGIARFVDAHSGWTLVGQCVAAPIDRLIVCLQKQKPDAVVLVWNKFSINPLWPVVKRVRKACPLAPVVLVARTCMGQHAPVAVNAGASACLPTTCAGDELIVALKAVLGGSTYFPFPRKQGRRRIERLTLREIEVMQQFADGQSTKSSADRLGISPKTVETHRAHIMDKLEIRSLQELTKIAIKEGLTPLNGTNGVTE